ncbi:hypothetical protein AB0K09_04165 [Streptomyces sp. NPDC049577]|uniref:hypothetical protein n=1 Tax=Streptomyces sp. NPDC049577 TaxID=3155153 RepID=UPI00343686C3
MTGRPHPKPGLRFTSANGEVVLHADLARHATLTALVAAWHEKGAPDDIFEALEHLADVCAPDRDAHPAMVDAAVEDLEDAACMEELNLRISWHDAERLHAELGALLRGRRLSARPVLGQRVPEQRTESGDAA